MSNVVKMEILQLKRNIEKHCKCGEERKIVVDTTNRMVSCDNCHAYLDPFEALLYIAEHGERYVRELKNLIDLRKSQELKQPRGSLFKELQRHYSGRGDKQMLPNCPHCRKSFKFEDIKGWTNAKYAPLMEREGLQNEV